jgi:hypothetical protein
VALLTLGCRSSAACSGRYKLLLVKGKRAPVGSSGKLTVPAGASRAAVVRLSRTGLARLRKSRKVTARLVVALSDGAGHARTDTSSFRLLAPKKR